MSILSVMVPSLFLIVGLYVLIWNERQRKIAEVASGWPVVTGRVVASRIRRARPKTDEDDCLIFSYQYEVAGVSYVGKRIDLFDGARRSSAPQKEAIIATYPCGAHVKTHYDPAAPSKSVIEPGNCEAYAPNRNMGVLVTMFGVFALAGIGYLEKWW